MREAQIYASGFMGGSETENIKGTMVCKPIRANPVAGQVRYR